MVYKWTPEKQPNIDNINSRDARLIGVIKLQKQQLLTVTFSFGSVVSVWVN